jgi:hypothetical protein
MIKRSKGGGFQVVSKKGRALSKKGISHAKAVKRLRQVEYFKHKRG